MQIFLFRMWNIFSKNYQRRKRSVQSGTLYERFQHLVQLHCMQEREVRFYANKLNITAKYLNFICKQNSDVTASDHPEEEPLEHVEVLRRGFLGFGRLEQVTISGTLQLSTAELVRDADGRIDVEATLAAHRALMVPDSSALLSLGRPSMASRAMSRLLNLRYRTRIAEAEALTAAARTAWEPMVRAALIRQRDEEA